MPRHDPDPLPDIDGLLPDGQRDSGWKRELAGPLVPAVSAAMVEGAQVAMKMPKSVRNLLKYIVARDGIYLPDVMWEGVVGRMRDDPDPEAQQRFREASADYARYSDRRNPQKRMSVARVARRSEIATMRHINDKRKTAR